MTMTNEQLSEAVKELEQCFSAWDSGVRVVGNVEAGVALQVIRQLWAEREAMEKESTEQCRIIGAGGERELALMTKIEEQRRDIEKMAAEREAALKERDDAEHLLGKQLTIIEQQRAVMEQAKAAIDDLRGTIDRDGIGAWSSQSPQAIAAMQAIAALESMGV